MAKKTYRINAVVGVPDAALDRAAIINHRGRVVRAASKGTRFVAAGEPVVLDEDEGDKLVAKHGGTVEDLPKKKVEIAAVDATSAPVPPLKAPSPEIVAPTPVEKA